MNCRKLGLFIVALASIGCSEDRKASAAPVGAARAKTALARDAVLVPPSSPYRAGNVANGGSISGTIQAGRDPLPETVTPAQELQDGCVRPPSRNEARLGAQLQGALVWISDIRAGKGFPPARRFELTNDACALSPRVLPVFVSATLNVGSNDAAIHNHRFVNVATGETEAVAPFNDSGEVIPFDRLLAKTAQYEVACEQHPWSRAWVLVFDHPYYAMTTADGSFSMSGVPPGTYRMRVWHPSYGFSDGIVTVSAGQSVSVAMKVGGAGVPAPSAVTDSAPRTPAGS